MMSGITLTVACIGYAKQTPTIVGNIISITSQPGVDLPPRTERFSYMVIYYIEIIM
jgi:hypothetical protein